MTNRSSMIGMMILIFLLSACGRQLPPPSPAASTGPQEAVTQPPLETEDAVVVEMPTVEAEVTEAVTEEVVVEAASETEEAEAEATEEADNAEETTLIAGDPVLGQTLFNQQVQTSAGPWLCASCHSVDENRIRLVGPGLYGIEEITDERLAESGEEDIAAYLHTSIVAPQDYIVPPDAGGPYPENLMPQNYGEVLSEEEIDALVAYILTLGN